MTNIFNVNVINGQGKYFSSAHLQIKNGKVSYSDSLEHTQSSAKEAIDAKHKWTVMPGLFDAHVHGYGGHDFADIGKSPEALVKILRALAATGLSYVMATFVSLETNELLSCLKVIDDFYAKQQKGETEKGLTHLAGIHLEGPFIAAECKGAHALSALQNGISIEKFRIFLNAAPHVKEWKITLAPDLRGAQEFIKQAQHFSTEGISVKIFLGHSNPQLSEIDQAVKSGASGFTHLGNACMETCCRQAKELAIADATSHLVQWVLQNPDRCPPGVELIVDGVHLSPSFVSLIWKSVPEKILLVTDALGPSGLPDGLYHLGSLQIRKEQDHFFLADDQGQILWKEGVLPTGEKGEVKSLAGSGVSLEHCVQNYIQTIGQSDSLEKKMQHIYRAAIKNPRASSLSLEGQKNLPEDQNAAVFDEEGRLVLTLCQGHVTTHRA